MKVKNATNVEKVRHLVTFMPAIVSDVKKDLKSEHLRSDQQFLKQYFAGKQRQKLTVDELVVAYSQEITEKENEGLAEFLCNRWLIKNTDLYDHFSTFLQKINPEFDDIESIDDEMAAQMVGTAEKEYGSLRTYLFAVLNSVVFSESVYADLAQRAEIDFQAASKPVQTDEVKSIEALVKKHEKELRKVTDKYEKRLLGLEKKYHQDTATLKKQVGNLQRKLSEQAASC
ncbi:Uncharacterized protein SCG7086_AA_00260 [Chlamydiales bacterium SCGC AG-110-P3]|nr:Uncharacterized protein SCG7086_AA_00260 [Chlamydiales bacterium SCGC AG-110-P3]